MAERKKKNGESQTEITVGTLPNSFLLYKYYIRLWKSQKTHIRWRGRGICYQVWKLTSISASFISKEKWANYTFPVITSKFTNTKKNKFISQKSLSRNLARARVFGVMDPSGVFLEAGFRGIRSLLWELTLTVLTPNTLSKEGEKIRGGWKQEYLEC